MTSAARRQQLAVGASDPYFACHSASVIGHGSAPRLGLAPLRQQAAQRVGVPPGRVRPLERRGARLVALDRQFQYRQDGSLQTRLAQRLLSGHQFRDQGRS